MKASLLACALLALALAACSEEKSAEPEKPPRPVRAVTVKHSPAGQSLTLTGTVQAQEQVNEAFRVGGKLATRTADLGADVKAGDQIATLDSSDAENQLKSAQADMTSAQSSLETAQANEQRQKALLQKGVITQAQYDDAKNQLSAAQSQADSAQARLKAANDTLSYTKLQSDATGKVTATGAEVGEVVGVGQMIVRLAKGDGRDAVFNVPARLLRTAPKDPDITLTLSDDASVTAKGKVREVGPQADAATGTYTVKISIVDPPRAMSLGASVVGSMTLDTTPVIQIPGSALMEKEGKPAVWVVGADGTVALQPVEIERHDADTMVVANGLKDGDVVVTAGVQTLVPGQKVRLLAAEAGAGS
jgi:RND family efflux transporter MFP subunit